MSKTTDHIDAKSMAELAGDNCRAPYDMDGLLEWFLAGIEHLASMGHFEALGEDRYGMFDHITPELTARGFLVAKDPTGRLRVSWDHCRTPEIDAKVASVAARWSNQPTATGEGE